jgi:hypothetical protein
MDSPFGIRPNYGPWPDLLLYVHKGEGKQPPHTNYKQMATTFQTNMIDTSYNGWTNYETWNVALWIQNDQDLYDLACIFEDYDSLVEVLYDEYGVKETKDGVKFNSEKINVVEINEMLQDL